MCIAQIIIIIIIIVLIVQKVHYKERANCIKNSAVRTRYRAIVTVAIVFIGVFLDVNFRQATNAGKC